MTPQPRRRTGQAGLDHAMRGLHEVGDFAGTERLDSLKIGLAQLPS